MMLSKDIKKLNPILSIMTFASLGELFLPMLEFCGKVDKECIDIEALELAAIKKLGLEVVGSQVKAPTPELHSQLISVIDEIGNKEVDLAASTLTIDQFNSLAMENSSLNAGQLLLVKKFLVS